MNKYREQFGEGHYDIYCKNCEKKITGCRCWSRDKVKHWTICDSCLKDIEKEKENGKV